VGVGGGLLDQMKIRLTQPSFTEIGTGAELGNNFNTKAKRPHLLILELALA
jgi:hypothetical protein